MRVRFVARQLLAAVMGGVLLGGCADMGGIIATAPSIPTGAGISEYYDKEFSVGSNLGAYPRDTLLVGIQYVDDHCAKYFDSLIELDRMAALKESAILTGSSQAQVLMGLAQKSAMAIARVAAVTEITKVLIEQYREKFTFAPHTSELRSLVMQSMNAERSELTSATTATSTEAIMAVKHYAQNCTIGAIHEHWDRSVAKAVQTGVKPEKRTAGEQSGGGDTESVFRSGNGHRGHSVLDVDRFVVR